MKKITLLALLFAVLLNSSAFSQNLVGKSFAGVAIGSWYGLGFSASYEKIFKDIQDLGIVGGGVEVGYATRKYDYGYWGGGEYGWKYTYVPVFAFLSFHYKLNNPKLDPYARAGFGYVYVKASDYGTYSGTWGSASASYVSFAGQAGIRYQVSPKMWVRAAAGTPWVASIGIDAEL